MSALAALFLLLDGVMKLVKPAPVVEATVQLGFPESVIFGLGIVLLLCASYYVIPRTSILGAIMLTGYLGGAVATQVRVGHPLFSHTLFRSMSLRWFGAGFFFANPGCAHLFLYAVPIAHKSLEICGRCRLGQQNSPATPKNLLLFAG